MMQTTKPMRLAVVGFGRVGQACAEAIIRTHDLSLAAIVRRSASVGGTIPEKLGHVPVMARIGQARDVQGALICVPTNAAADVASQMLQHGVPIVDCATLHGDALHAHKGAVHKAALHHKTVAIVGAGWDPGALSMFRAWFALLTPGGMTETTRRPGASLRHTIMARTVEGVKDALCAEVRAADGRLQRYVYVELEKGAVAERITEAIRADPLFVGEETQVFVVEQLAALEQEGRGVLLDRRGPSGGPGHDHFLLEARFDETLLTAQVMIAAARALPQLEAGAYSLADVPLGLLWGERAEKAERDWL